MEVIRRMMWSLNACILNAAWQRFACFKGLKEANEQKTKTSSYIRDRDMNMINYMPWHMYIYIYAYISCCWSALRTSYMYDILLYWYIDALGPKWPLFDFKRPCFGGLTFKNRGHLGSRCIYIYIHIRSYRWYSMNLFLGSSTVSDLWVFSFFTR